jgi:hypothetical protein
MAREIWEAFENDGDAVVSRWPKLSSETLAKLDSKLEMLQNAEVGPGGKVLLPSKLLAGPGVYGQSGIYKLIINGKQAIRPMLCLGPQKPASEWTILARATKKDNDTSDAYERVRDTDLGPCRLKRRPIRVLLSARRLSVLVG